MTYAGAKGNTRTEMAKTLHFTLPEEILHAGFNKLDFALSSSEPVDDATTDTNQDAETETEESAFVFRTANSLWAQQNFTFLDSFLDPLALNYGAGVNLMDFENQPEEARQTINAWVEEQTNDKIVELLKEGMIDELTRLVLTNAVYFYGSWKEPFMEDATVEEEFTQLDGATIAVPTMKSPAEYFGYVASDGHLAVQLPYIWQRDSGNFPQGKTGMMIIVPDVGSFETFESQFDMQMVANIVNSMHPTRMHLYMPKWEFRSDLPMASTLEAMDMVDAFDPEFADFSGMNGEVGLYIGDVIHQAFVAVDENGTEAAAATAVIVSGTQSAISHPDPIEVRINRPFIFLIRDLETGAILFVGRVLNPVTAE